MRHLLQEEIKNKKILVVGGGDSAIEAALLLMHQNKVTLSYRGETFSRLKLTNNEKIKEAISLGQIDMKFGTNVVSIHEDYILYSENQSADTLKLENDLVYIFAGGELPTEFLKKTGINVTTKYGEKVLKHR